MRQGSVSIRGSMRPAWPTILRGSLRVALLTVLCCVLSANAVQAAAVITCSISEGPGIVDGVLGIDDTVIVTAIASYGPGTSMIHMSADLSPLGLSPVATMSTGGGMNYSYTSGSLLPAMLPGTNYLQRTFAVRAIDNLGGMAIGTTNAYWVDNVAPAGNLPAVSPATVSGGNTVTVTIRDANYQSAPGGGTTAVANLGPLGLPPLALTWNGSQFQGTFTAPDGSYTTQLSIALRDPVNATTPTYLTNTLRINPVPPTPTVSATVLSGNNPARPGDILRLYCQVPNYENDTCVVSAATLATNATALSSPGIITSYTVPLTGSTVVGSPSSWTLDLTLLAGARRTPPDVRVYFQVTDGTGNTTITSVPVNVDLDPPNSTTPDATVYMPNNTTLGDPGFASSTCWIEFAADITTQVSPFDPLEVSVNVASIGGPAVLAMPETPLGSNHYAVRFEIPASRICEDNVLRAFTITARDPAGNVIYRNSTPVIGVDNTPPLITLPTSITRVGGGTNIRVGDQFTISAAVSGVEAGSVTVDLSRINPTWHHAPLLWTGIGNEYANTWTLQSAAAAGASLVDGALIATITARDTLNAGLLPGHTVTAVTPSIEFDNEPPQVIAATYTCPAVGVPTLAEHPKPRIGDTVNLLVSLASSGPAVHDSETVTVDLTDIGGGAATAMTYVPGPVGVPGTYTYSFTIATGTKNDGATFTVLFTDNAGNAGTPQLISVPLDNMPPNPGTLTVTKPFPILKIGDTATFTVSCPVSTGSPASTSLDLSIMGAGIRTSQTPVGGVFNFQATGTAVAVENTAYVFSATVYDNAGNSRVVQSTAQSVDCLPPSIASKATLISPDTPQIGTVNLGDRILVYAKMDFFSDPQSITATLGTGSVATPLVFDTAAMTYNALTVRHEALFNPQTAAGGWLYDLEGPATFTITAIDDAGNIASATGLTQPIDNTVPVGTLTLVLVGSTPGAPEIDIANVLNVASFAQYDRLIASATLAGAISSATIDLTPLGASAAHPISNASTTPGCMYSAPLDPVTWGCVRDVGGSYPDPYTLFARLYEPSGNSVVTSAQLRLDTWRPRFTAAALNMDPANAATLTLTLSEDCGNVPARFSFDNATQLIRIHGLSGGVPTSVSLGIPPDAIDPISLGMTAGIGLGATTLSTIANWDSTCPLSVSIATGVIDDLASNTSQGIPTTAPLSISLPSDNTWRTSPTLIGVVATSTWPAGISITLMFNKPLDPNPATVNLYRACIVTPAGRTTPGTFDYTCRYHFRPAPEPAPDTFVFSNSNRWLTITLGAYGMDWFARKIGGTASQVSVAIDGIFTNVFARDANGRPVNPVAYSAPITGPIQPSPNGAGFRIVSLPRPKLFLGTSTLMLNFIDRAFLTSSDYDTSMIYPVSQTASMGLPLHDQAHAFTAFNSRIVFHTSPTGGASQAVVTGAICDVTQNTEHSSTTVVLTLSATDMQNIMNLRTQTLYLAVSASAFRDNWGNLSAAYLPTGPGNLDVAPPPTTGSGPYVSAFVLNNATSPYREPAPNTMWYEVEIVPGTYTAGPNTVTVPIDQTFTPVLQFTTPPGVGPTEVTPPVFNSWTTRTVAGQQVNIARFRNGGVWTGAFQRQAAQFSVSNIRDVFGNTTNATSTLVQANAQRSTTLPIPGFTSASFTLQLDNVAPSVYSIEPNSVPLGAIPAGSASFIVRFDEYMASATLPTLTLTRGAETIHFTFSSWDNPSLASYAVYANVEAITAATTNGTWAYNCSGGRDLAGNTQNPSTAVFGVYIQTQGPALTAAPTLSSVQSFVSSSTVLTNYTYSPYAGSLLVPTAAPIASVTYSYLFPAQATPHWMQLYTATGTQVASSPLSTVDGALTGVAALDASNFTPTFMSTRTGPITLNLRIMDGLGSARQQGTITYDSAPPRVNSFSVSGVGSFSNGVAYYNPANTGNLLTTVTLAAVDSPLRLVTTNPANATQAAVALTGPAGTSYSTNLGVTYSTEGDYRMHVVDPAGNPGVTSTGALALCVVHVDTTSPTVALPADVRCTTHPGGVIGVTPVGGAEFEVTFSDATYNLINTSYIPTLEIASGSDIIHCNFLGWLADNRTARFNNADEIPSSRPEWTGTWRYRISGARDLALNQMDVNTAFTVELRTQPPLTDAATIWTWPLTLDVSTGLRANQPFSNSVPTPTSLGGVATLTVHYASNPANLPHRLQVLDGASLVIATLSMSIDLGARIGTATIDPATWTLGAVNNTAFYLRIIDANDNLGPVYDGATVRRNLYFDNVAPNLNAWSFGTLNTDPSGNTIYYSPTALPAALATATFAGADTLVAIVATSTGPATWTLSVNTNATAPNPIHSYSLAGLANMLATDGSYAITLADAAGNLAVGVGTTSVRTLIRDTVAPTETAIIAAPPDSPTNIGTGTHVFVATFSEPMDPNFFPVLVLATTTTPATPPITTTFQRWLGGGLQAEFRTDRAITPADVQGSWTLQLTGGRDLAGNAFTPAPPRTVTIYSRGPSMTGTVVTINPASLDGTVHTDYPFSAAVGWLPGRPLGPGSATVSFSYVGTPLFEPHELQLWLNDTTFAASAPVVNGAAGIDPVAMGWNVPTVSLATYVMRIVDTNGNYGILNRNLYLDTASPTAVSMDFPGLNVIGNNVYYSRGAKPTAVASVTLAADDTFIAVIASPTVASYPLPVNTNPASMRRVHSFSMATLMAPLATDASYLLTFTDAAGNPGVGPATRTVVFDNASPTETLIIAAPPDSPYNIGTGPHTFTVTFSEPMDPAIIPTLTLATTTPATTITTTFTAWGGGNTQASFATTRDVTSGDAQGSWTFQLSGGRDLAGNPYLPSGAAREMVIYSRGPVFAPQLLTQQYTVDTGATTFFNPAVATQPWTPSWSTLVLPGVATLSISYSQGPYGPPHRVLIYNGATLIGSAPVTLSGGASGYATLNAAVFNPLNPPTGNYSVRIIDNNGNVGFSGGFTLYYDVTAAGIATFSFAGPRVTTPGSTYYYSPSALGPRPLVFTGMATTTEPLRLAVSNGPATWTWAPPINPDASRRYTWTFAGNDAMGGALPEGTYNVCTADNAGNLSVGSAANQQVVIDRTAPVLTVIGSPTLHVAATGNATYTLEIKSTDAYGIATSGAVPTLSLATGGIRVDFVNTGWWGGSTVMHATATYISAAPLTATMPQGVWHLTAYGNDLAGNLGSFTMLVNVQTRGPTLDAIRVFSYQSTTASEPLPGDVLTDVAFSPLVPPNAATIRITWPASPTMPLSLIFRQGAATVASASLVGRADAASATILYPAQVPGAPLPDGTYDLVVVTDFNDPSTVQGRFVQDSVAPRVIVAGLPNDPHLASDVYYVNPTTTPAVAFTGSVTPDNGPLLMRATSGLSTDTWAMSLDSTSGAFSGTFTGLHDTTEAWMPDGQYRLAVVDAAGNVAIPVGGAPATADICVDTSQPTVSGYAAFVGANPVTRFNPNIGNLTIVANTTEAAAPTGAAQILVRAWPFDTTVARLPATVRVAGTSVEATWDGRDQSTGAYVANGTYKFVIADMAGNTATDSLQMTVNAQPFLLSSVTQTTAAQVRLNFNQDVDPTPANLAGMGLTVIDDTGAAAPPVLTRQLASGGLALDLGFAAPLTDGRQYTVTIMPGTLRSGDLVPIAAPNNTGTVRIDARAAVIASTNFNGITSARGVNVVFDEPVTLPSADALGNWQLAEGARTIGLTGAVLQADRLTVRLTAVEDLTDAHTYLVTATNILDAFQNPSATSRSFTGRDLTPPVLTINAFSNPANEYNVSVIVQSNEALGAAPIVRVTQGGTFIGEVTMKVGSQPRLYLVGVALSPGSSGAVQLEVRGSDAAGNQGNNSLTFNTATVSASQRTEISSIDGTLRAVFDVGAVNANTLAKVFTHTLATGSTITANRRALRISDTPTEVLTGALRAAQASTELVPTGPAYELALPATKVARGFSIRVAIPGARDQDGLGLFMLAADGAWTFAGKACASGSYAINTTQPTHYAILRDTQPPAVTMTTVLDANKPLRTEQPELTGSVSDGTGVNATSLRAILDSVELPMTTVGANGPQVAFRFVPPFPLVSGEHTFAVRATDLTGNTVTTPAQTFAVDAPLKIMEIQTFPNPARRFAKVRIAVNRRDLSGDLVDVTIYDVSGARVGTLADINPVFEQSTGGQRYLYDIPWDLTNGDGNAVANGVYLLRIRLHDPLDPEKTTKITHKVAVLR